MKNKMTYTIEFYENKNGESQIWNLLEKLRQRTSSSKDARIQYKQITLYIQLLQENGTHLPDNIVKHIDENLWELRPGNNRIFFFCYTNNTFVLLHCFRKKTQKTPYREIQKAKTERDDYLIRKENV